MSDETRSDERVGDETSRETPPRRPADPVEETVNPAREESLHVRDPAPVVRDEHAEGAWTRAVEQQTAKIPSSVFLVAALGAMAASVALELAGRHRASRFVGMWPPTLLIAGVYNKLVKTFGPR
jgi:hypothetical protein